jgi:hypothetical protein
MKKITVVFYPNTARIYKGDYTPSNKYPYLINPVLPTGIPPHQWILSNGKIEVKSQIQQPDIPIFTDPITSPISEELSKINKKIYFLLGIVVLLSILMMCKL